MYSITWGSSHPGLLLFIIDLSESMSWTDKNETTPRINKVLSILFQVLDNMARNNTSPDPSDPNKLIFKETFTVKVMGYNYMPYTSPLLFDGGCKALDNLLSQHWEKPETLFDTAGAAKPQFQTRSDRAFEAAANLVKDWVATQGSNAPAPIVLHITDGHPEERGIPNDKLIADCKAAARKITDISTPDGNAMLFNIHIAPDNMEPLIFPSVAPDSDPKHPERRFLFDISTQLSPQQVEAARRSGIKAMDGCRFMASNVSNSAELLRLIEFGSTVSQGPGRAETPYQG